MKRIQKSFGHALDGLVHAIKTERNLQLFIPVYIVLLLLALPVIRVLWEWIALLMAGGVFLSIELINTSFERLLDVLDDQKKILGSNHYHSTVKAAKDVGAAASLVALLMLIAVVVIVFWPYVKLLVS
jgi:undecaprenol kinase